MDGIQCSQFTFYNNFDSANLARVEFIPQDESCKYCSCTKYLHSHIIANSHYTTKHLKKKPYFPN